MSTTDWIAFVVLTGTYASVLFATHEQRKRLARIECAVAEASKHDAATDEQLVMIGRLAKDQHDDQISRINALHERVSRLEARR